MSPTKRFVPAPLALVTAALLAMPLAASAADDHDHHDHSMHMDHSMHQSVDHSQHDQSADAAGDDPHAHHRAMMDQKGYKRSLQTYRLSDFKLMSKDGSETSLLAEIDSDKPVMVNFIFTTCTTICPIMTGTFAQVQSSLGPEAEEVRMVSFSIDPEYDTPERLRTYAEMFKAGDQWQFLTGDLDSIVAVQRSFNVYRGNKMSHQPVTLMRRSPADPWVRLDGIASAAEIVAEYRQMVAN
jgi:protein SCO1/2